MTTPPTTTPSTTSAAGSAPAMTKTRARALARRARTRGHYRTSTTTIELPCPLGTGEPGRLAHRVTVWHQVSAVRPTAAQVDAAFIEHYTNPYPEDRCPHVPGGDR
jgi:hypothetical protein